jgi:hypothetical protein
MSEATAPHDEEIKALLAYFGSAYYLACGIEAELANALVTMDFVTGVLKDARANGKSTFSQAEYEARFDSYLAEQHRETMGGLIRRLNKVSTFDETLKKLIDEALTRRNYLAHRFWRERAEEFASTKKRASLIPVLEEYVRFFESIDQELHKARNEALKKLGFDTEAISARVEAQIAEMRAKDKE